MDFKTQSYLFLHGIALKPGSPKIVIVGGGEPKEVQKLQQDDKLKDENYFLRELSQQITERLKDGEIWFTNDKMDFEGNLEFNDEDDE